MLQCYTGQVLQCHELLSQESPHLSEVLKPGVLVHVPVVLAAVLERLHFDQVAVTPATFLGPVGRQVLLEVISHAVGGRRSGGDCLAELCGGQDLL